VTLTSGTERAACCDARNTLPAPGTAGVAVARGAATSRCHALPRGTARSDRSLL